MRIAIWAGATSSLLLLGLRWCYAHSYRWNSDEPQHLHVVWAWANGFLPYRDVFDNHTPLFHILSAPLFAFLGERPDIVIPMRLAMVPLFGLGLWCVYRIGAKVFSPRSGIWSAILLGFFPPYFFLMGQFRTDVLWTVLWLGLLAILTGDRLGKVRSFVAGLIMGAAFGVSMKSTLLLLITLTAGGLTWLWRRRFAPSSEGAPSPQEPQPRLSFTAALGGFFLMPLLILGYFTIHGAFGELYYCVIIHNTLPGEHTPLLLLQRLASWGWLTLLPAAALSITTRSLFMTDASRAARRVFLILSAGIFYPVLHGLWRMITPQDYAPWLPLLALVAVPHVIQLERFAGHWGQLVSTGLFVILAGTELCVVLNESPVFGPGSVHHVAAIAQTLRLTNRDEYVMDGKGEMIFRQRPYYFALETLTRERLSAGLLKDDLPERLIETRTAVVRIPHVGMTERSLAFVRSNYVPAGFVSVLGKILPRAESGTIVFDVTIPERYSIVTKRGPVEGNLDGSPLIGGCWLAAGNHKLQLANPADASGAILVWTRALERGCSPSFDTGPTCAPERRHARPPQSAAGTSEELSQ